MSTQVTETKSFDGQVAGHGNILILPNNILIKRSYPKEINFYKLIKEKNLPLQNFMPKCYNHDPSYEEIKEKYIPKDGVVYIVMENLLLPFKNPNVMDLKFGTRLYDEGVTEAKKERMIYNATSTTSFKTGLKICGVHITDKSDKSLKKIGKKYGRALKEENLANGILRFLLNYTDECYKNVTTPETYEEDLDQTVFDKKPSKYTLGFIQEVLNQTYKLKEAVMQSPIRIYGSSLCLIYETINVEEELKKYERANQEDNDEKYQYPFTYHLIDFAHANFVDPSLGEDPSFITGINRLISILENFIYENSEH
ncbi:SAICAR synthase-like protein [Neocallimastix californiae]|jgi:hypothetical protein|uniref:Kinase n=1 Tax=Neocallimastix californiae TaxID=1754190 RepID=A0A1Y2E003_9FUNG|nr:SAICAR synthase-like protein [Neocallimastix californiae]|eukprot:ORY64684.1 SAICAR synthase-like protein [Neocallimastix californiae]